MHDRWIISKTIVSISVYLEGSVGFEPCWQVGSATFDIGKLERTQSTLTLIEDD